MIIRTPIFFRNTFLHSLLYALSCSVWLVFLFGTSSGKYILPIHTCKTMFVLFRFGEVSYCKLPQQGEECYNSDNNINKYWVHNSLSWIFEIILFAPRQTPDILQSFRLRLNIGEIPRMKMNNTRSVHRQQLHHTMRQSTLRYFYLSNLASFSLNM